MILLSLATAHAGLSGAPTPTETCETSTFWKRVDESVLDLVPPEGTREVTVSIGCRFVSPPGAVVDVAFGDAEFTGLEVLGIRRELGQLIVAAPVARAPALEARTSVARVEVVRGGDWRPLLMEVHRLQTTGG